MRVITGKARGRKLETLSGDDVRPTTEKVKESVFNIIQFDIEGRRFLDLFAGSGQMGIEALSRGAKTAVFVDASKNSMNVIKKNLMSTGLVGAKTVMSDSISYIKNCDEMFDIAFLDPPYKTGLLQSALSHLPKNMNKGGRIICEHPSDEQPLQTVGDFVIEKQRRYGKIIITVYIHKDFVELA